MADYFFKENNVKHQKWLIGPAVVACTLGVAGLMVSQTKPANGQGAPPPGQRPGGPGGNRPNFGSMSPEKMQQMRQQFMERRVRDELTRAGYGQKTIQDPVVKFVQSQMAERTRLRDKASKLRQAVAGKASDAQIAKLLAELRAAAQAAKAHRDLAQKQLNAKIGYSKKPRLEAVLTLAGVVGDGQFMGGPGGFGGPRGFGGPGGPRGFGGPGGPGGPGGGPGGFGGRRPGGR